MEKNILLKANIKRHKGTLCGIFILTFLAAAALGTVMTIWFNSGQYMQNELERTGFGTLTAWVANLPQTNDLQEDICALDGIGRVETQLLIYTDYMANGLESDSEGQLISYIPAESRYRFFTDDLSGYTNPPESILPGEVYVSPSMVSMFGIGIGDTVTVRGGAGSGEYIVSGIYSCANDMGGNLGMNREGYLQIGQDYPNLWCLHYFLADSSQKEVIADALENAYGGDVHVHENTWSGLFGIISAMRALLLFMYALVIVFILIVTVMTSSKILSAEQRDLGIYKAIGFSSVGLQCTFSLRFAIVSLFGGLVGTVLAAVLTDSVVGSMMKLAGISNFSSNPGFFTAVLPMAVVVALFTVFGWLSAVKIRKVPLAVLTAE